MDVIGLNGQRITLLVLPPSTAEAIAHQVLMMKASRRDNVDGIDELLVPIGAVMPAQPDGYLAAAAVDRWEVGRGRLLDSMTYTVSATAG